jgi:hypothetical protein
MTNGTVALSRMTNGTVGAAGKGNVLTVQYAGGAQTISIPDGVVVTAITPASGKLTPGARVVVLTTKGADGAAQTSSVMLTGPIAPSK